MDRENASCESSREEEEALTEREREREREKRERERGIFEKMREGNSPNKYPLLK
jgi:hypothetical protein